MSSITGRSIEYFFLVEPEADSRRIRLKLEGIGRMHLERGGSVVIRTAASDIRLHPPVES